MKKAFITALCALSLCTVATTVSAMNAETCYCPTYDWEEIETVVREKGSWESGNMVVTLAAVQEPNS